jgi:hypothetical protein
VRYQAFVGPSYTSQSRVADAERLVNLYPERMESPGAKAQYVLYPTPGVTTFATATEAPGRGLFAHEGRCFAVTGYRLYEPSSAGVLTNRGDVQLDTNPVTWATNGDGGNQLLVTSGDHAYVLDLSSHVLTEVLATGAAFGGFLDGFFLALDAATSTLQISNLLDGLTWSPSQIAQRTAGSDRWVSMVVAHREIWLFGSLTTEVWYNAGTAPFPFAPIPGAFLQHGILAPHSVAQLGSPVWLGQSKDGPGMVYQADGYAARRISNHALEYALSTYETLADAVGWTYQEQGHSFYVLTFPAAGATWVYDASTQLWHERGKWNTDTATYDAWRPQYHAYVFGKHLVADRATGTIHEASVTMGSDVDGAAIRRVRRAPHLTQEQRQVIYKEFEIDLETGLGLATGQGSDPQVMLRVSRDGGRTFGPERQASAGRQGQYRQRVSWTRLGAARDAVFEVSVSDPTPWRIVDAYLTLEMGTH